MLFRISTWPGILEMILWNLLLGAAFHLILLYLCMKRQNSTFDPERPRYLPRSWERGGKFYKDKLKIHLWKEKVPQFVGKDGFSKEHLVSEPTLAYVDVFIRETCRGEWYHSGNLLFIFVILIVDPIQCSWIFCVVLSGVHIPCVMIQRYNRFRLQVLRKKILRDMQKGGQLPSLESIPVSIPCGEADESASQ